MKFTDMDMLQDYEKDSRMAVLGYAWIETEITDGTLRKLIEKGVAAAAESQRRASTLIIARGDRP